MKNINIAIPAYNAQDNIVRLVDSLLKQNTPKCNIKKIVVYSDNSKDNTVKLLRSIKNRKLLIIDSKKRRGFGGAVEYLIKLYKNDLLIILNDDILIKDKSFIQRISDGFISTDNGLACIRLEPIRVNNFIQKAQYSSRKSFHEMINNLKSKDCVFTIDGKCLAISRNFANKAKFPKNKSLVGNVDSYLYFYCMELNMKYKYIDTTQAYFVFPDSFKEFYKWTVRNSSNQWILKKRFGSYVNQEYHVHKERLLVPMIKEFLLNPLGIFLIWIAAKFAESESKNMAKSFNPFWETIKSTKKL